MRKNKMLKNRIIRDTTKKVVDGILGVVQKISHGEDLRYFDEVYDFILNMSADEFADYQISFVETKDASEMLSDVLPAAQEVEVDPYDPEVYI